MYGRGPTATTHPGIVDSEKCIMFTEIIRADSVTGRDQGADSAGFDKNTSGRLRANSPFTFKTFPKCLVFLANLIYFQFGRMNDV